MSPFDREHTTSYWRSIVTMALSRVVSEIFNIEKCRTLKSGSEVTQGHWKWFCSIDCVWYDVTLKYIMFFSNTVLKTHHFWDIRLQKCRDLENRVRGPSRSLEMSLLDKAHMPSYWRSIVTMALSHVVSEIFNVENIMTLKFGSVVTQGHRNWHGLIHNLWFPINVP